VTAVAVETDVAPSAPLAWWRQWGVLRHVARARASVMFAYRNTMFLFFCVSIVQIFMLKKVWGALYAARPGVLSVPLPDLIVYLTLANLIVWSFPTHTVSRYLRERIREGSVVFDLVRPIGFVPQLAAQLVGALGGSLVIIVIALPVVALAGSLSLPASGWAAGMFLVSLLCGWGIAGLLTMLLSMVAFWTLEIDGLTTLYALVASFLSGALVPVQVFPGALRTVVEWLPFQATTYVPASIYIGTLDGAAAWRAVGLQLVWVVVLGAAAALMWRGAVRRVVVQGG
jgi:ABC-2 type transport system permease protein